MRDQVAVGGRWVDPATGVRMVARQIEHGIGYLTPRLQRCTRSLYGIEVEYQCGCLWELDPMAGANVRSMHDLPQTCPNHDPATVPAMCSHDWIDTTSLGSSYNESVCSKCGCLRVYGSLSFATNILAAKTPSIEPPKELELTFQTEPIVGWRAWRVINYERHGGLTEPRLQSLTGREKWEPMTRLEGHCVPNKASFGYTDAPRVAHEAPWPNCLCGVWATRERVDSEREMLQGGSGLYAMGEVYLWGRVLEFERGWRARYAYPKSLILLGGDEAKADELRRLYGVPVTCGPHLAPLVNDHVASFSLALANSVQSAAAMKAFSLSMKQAAEALAALPSFDKKTLSPPRPKPSSRETFKYAKKLLR